MLCVSAKNTTPSGIITEETLVKILNNKRGEPFSSEEMDAMYKGNPPITGGIYLQTSPDMQIISGKVDYKAFAHLITTGAQDQISEGNCEVG